MHQLALRRSSDVDKLSAAEDGFTDPVEHAFAGEAKTAVKASAETDRARNRENRAQVGDGGLLGDQGDDAAHGGCPQDAAQQPGSEGDHHDETWRKPYTDKSQREAPERIEQARGQCGKAAYSVAEGCYG